MDSKSKNKKSTFVNNGDFKTFLRAIIALLVSVMLVFSCTFAWIEGSKNAGAAGDECTVTAGAGLEFIGVGSGDISVDNILTLPSNVNYVDCSSVDGRNFFFPTAGSISTTTTSTTNNLVFRKGVEADQNSKYLTKDFIIKSLEAEGTTGSTPVYIGSSSYFKVSGATNNTALPYRISLNFNDGTAPILICPGVVKPSPVKETASAVSAINERGVATTQTSSALSVANYYYGLTPVYRLPYGESRRVTVSVWLEGTDTNCTEDLAGAKIEMNLNLTTEDSDMRAVKFVDYTPKTWVGNDNATLYVVDESTNAYYKMNALSDGKTYTASIPNTLETGISFQRSVSPTFDPSQTEDFNKWSSNEADSLSTSSTYYAIGQGPGLDPQNPVDDKNYGYWVKDDCTKIVDVYLTDNGNELRVLDRSAPFVYIFGNSSAYGEIKAWGGFQMVYVGQNSNDQSVYHMYLPADSNASLVFDNNLTGTSLKQTVNIPLSSSFKTSDPQVKRIGFYLNGNDNGKFTVGTWDPTNFTPSS